MLVEIYFYFKNLWDYYFPHETPEYSSSSEDLAYVYDYQPSAPPLTNYDYQPAVPSAPTLSQIEGHYDYNSYY